MTTGVRLGVRLLHSTNQCAASWLCCCAANVSYAHKSYWGTTVPKPTKSCIT